MQTDVLCHVAVSSATYAIDKPYTYLVPESLEQRIQPGMRVIVPFGTGNRRVEGLILDLFSGERKRGLKPVRTLLDETPVLDPSAIKLALWMRERYFCTVYDAVKAMLPAGLYFSLKDRYSIVSGIERETAYAVSARPMARRALDMIYASGGTMEKGVLLTAFGESDPLNATWGISRSKSPCLICGARRHTLNSPVAHPANRPFCTCWRRCRRSP